MNPRPVRDVTTIGRVIGECRGLRGRLVALLLLGLAATPLALLVPVPLMIAIDSVIGSDPPPGLLQDLIPERMQASQTGLLVFAAVLHVVIVLLEQLRAAADEVLRTVTGERVTLGFRSRLFGQAQRLSFAFHDQRGTADSVHRIQYDAPAIRYIIFEGLLPLVAAVMTVLGMVYVMVRLDAQLALVALAISPLLFVSVSVFRRKTRPEYRRVKRLESSALGVVQEVLTSLRVVQAYGREGYESERFVDVSSEGVRQQVRLVVAERLFSVLVQTVTAVGTAVVLYIGVRSVQSGTLTLGEFLVVFTYIARLYDPIRAIARRSASMQRHLAGAERALELLDQTPDVEENPHAQALHRARGDIRFEGVDFSYDGETRVLSDISMVVPPGGRVGIRGPTGSGKTTLVSLLSRFYDPSGGRILLDGVDLRDLRIADLRRQIAIMLQEPVLFSTTIAENIAYARPGATQSEIEAAARYAGAHEFVSELPDGYQTLVGERGMRLSGGERQRISLARAFLKDAPILILDEPTSSIDLATEASIMERLEFLMRGRTTFMIAHRTSTLEKCHIVFEVSEGVLSVVTGGLDTTPEPAPARDPVRRWMRPGRRKYRSGERRVALGPTSKEAEPTTEAPETSPASTVPSVTVAAGPKPDRPAPDGPAPDELVVLDDVIQLRDETPIIDLVELDDETDLAILEVLGEHDDGLSATQWQMRCKGVVGRSAFRRARARLTAAGLVDNHGTEDRTRFLLTEKGLDVVTSPAPRKVTNNPSQSDHPVNIL